MILDDLVLAIRLEELKRKLMPRDYEELGLEYLEPLRFEVQKRLKQLCESKK